MKEGFLVKILAAYLLTMRERDIGKTSENIG
jgi:hypothetical protein